MSAQSSRIPDAVLDDIRSRLSVDVVVSRKVRLTGPKAKRVGVCPFHNETTGSFHVYPDHFHCFGCGAHGDVFEFVMRCEGVDFNEAVARCAAEAGITIEGRAAASGVPVRSQPAEVIPLRPKAAEYEAIMPVPDEAGRPEFMHRDYGEPEHVAVVRNQGGEVLYYIARYPATEARRKMIVPLTWGVDRGKPRWNAKAPAAPRPLYGLPLLDEVPVLVVEGEMKRDAAARLLGGRASVVSWPNGAQSIGKTDWSPLAGRVVVIWPDADNPGADAAAAIVNVLRGVARSLAVVPALPDVPKGWDLADAEREGWTGDQVWARVTEARGGSAEREEVSSADLGPHMDERDDHGPSEDPRDDADARPFVALGHNRGRYFFFSRQAGQIVVLTPREMKSDAHLGQLAPLKWWEFEYPGKTAFNLKAAVDALLQACFARGVYDPDMLRGRGAWLDEGRTVLHLGDRLVVDGQPERLATFGSQFIYEQGARLALLPDADPLGTKEARRLIDLCMQVAWEDRDGMGRWLAGWLVIAPICGAMPWRPHIWITSEAGDGKSWVMDNLVRPLVGAIALRVASKTTESGVRRALGLDARPVVFDEAETQGEKDRVRMQEVLDLARLASSEDSPAIYKGDSQSGGVIKSMIRSCFAFSSVNLGLSQAADESRTVVLTLAPPADQVERAEGFAKLKELHAEVLTPEFPARLLARTLSLLPVIRHNSEVFADAIARTGAGRRTGDTLGVLLAGAWSLRSTRAATPAEAEEFVTTTEWVKGGAARAEAEPEWRRALSHLCQIESGVSLTKGRMDRASLGDLISVAATSQNADAAMDAETALRRARIMTKPGELWFGNDSDLLRRGFSDTPWGSSWAATLLRTPGARRLGTTRFGSGPPSRGIAIPLAEVI